MTSITLETPQTGGPPAVKFPAIGNSVVVGIVNVEEYRQYDIDGEPVTFSDGSPRMGKKVTGLVVTADGAVITESNGERPVQPGELVTFYCEKGRFFTWRDAVAEAGGANVGDVMKWWWDHELAPKKPGYNPQKVQKAKIRRPKPEDGDLADRCVAAYHDQQARPVVEAPTPQAAPAPAASDVEDPF